MKKNEIDIDSSTKSTSNYYIFKFLGKLIYLGGIGIFYGNEKEECELMSIYCVFYNILNQFHM